GRTGGREEGAGRVAKMDEGPHKFLPLFITEAGEQLQQLGAELVKLEQEPAGSAAVWDSIFRRLHSLKGSAATVGIKPIVEIAHEAEALVGRLKASGARPERAQIDLLLQASDVLTAQVARVAADLARANKEEQTGNSALLARLAEASKAVVVPDVTPTPPPVKQPAA